MKGTVYTDEYLTFSAACLLDIWQMGSLKIQQEKDLGRGEGGKLR